jgi:hypothetical protein
MKRYIVSVVFLVATLVTCFAQEQKTFSGSGPYFHYSIQYPSSWKAVNRYGFVELTSPSKPTGNFKEKILVTVTDAAKGKNTKTLEEFNDSWLKIIPNEVSNFEMLDKGESTLAGKRALFYIYKGKKEKARIKAKRYIFTNKTNIYEVTFETQEKLFLKNLSPAEKIMASITVHK